MSKKTILPYSDDFNPDNDDELRRLLRELEWHPNSFTHLDREIREIVNLEGENASKKYTYPSRKNALFSLQLYEGFGPVDLKMVSNIGTKEDRMFMHPGFDSERHGKFVAEFIKQHMDGNTLAWFKEFIASAHSQLNKPAQTQSNEDTEKPKERESSHA